MEKNSNSKELTIRARLFSIERLVSCAIIILFAAIVFLHPAQQILASGLFLLFGHIVSLFVILAFAIVLFRQSRHNKKTTILIFGFILSMYIMGAGWIVLYIWFQNVLYRNAGLLFTTIAIALGLVTSITSFQNKRGMDRFLLLTFVALLSISLVMIAPISLSLNLPYIYTPPALTTENMVVYNKYVKFVKKYDEYIEAGLSKRKDASNWGLIYGLSNILYGEGENNYFSEHEIIEMGKLHKQLYSIKCQQIKRSNDLLMFYKNANYILPVSPGVVYSLSGKNPNEVDSEVLIAAEPFTKIAGNWYMSRELMLRGPRTDLQVSIPKSLIDYSLRTEGLNLDSETDKKSEPETNESF